VNVHCASAVGRSVLREFGDCVQDQDAEALLHESFGVSVGSAAVVRTPKPASIAANRSRIREMSIDGDGAVEELSGERSIVLNGVVHPWI
jgi:hypothetical protein